MFRSQVKPELGNIIERFICNTLGGTGHVTLFNELCDAHDLEREREREHTIYWSIGGKNG